MLSFDCFLCNSHRLITYKTVRLHASEFDKMRRMEGKHELLHKMKAMERGEDITILSNEIHKFFRE